MIFALAQSSVYSPPRISSIWIYIEGPNKEMANTFRVAILGKL